MSAYQLLLLDRIPGYAVVSESVDIARKIAGGHYASLVNAVLRKMADNNAQKVALEGYIEKLGVEASHPDWLLRLWEAHYGREIMEEICWNDLQPGRIALKVNTMKTSEQQLLEDPLFSKGTLNNCLYYDGNILDTDYFRNDLVSIQSESSQKVVLKVSPNPGERILDMCAAPGTKSIQMAIHSNDQAEIMAVDLYPQRVALIDQAVERHGLKNITTRCLDARNLPKEIPLYYFDKVLLDAPCSGLGTLKHKPEIKINTRPEDLDDIIMLQAQLLEAACLMLKPGGQLIYSTCTLNRKENDRQIRQFLLQHEEFELVSEETIFPFVYDSDGFYIANLRKSMLE